MPDNLIPKDAPEAVQRELTQLEGRDLQLWCLAALMVLVLGVGFLALLVPRVVWQVGTAVVTEQNLPALFFGLLALLFLLSLYMVQQRVRLTATRKNLIKRLLESERLARIDPVTGLFNRRVLDEVLTREMARAQRTGSRLSIVMIDIDGFKGLNTRFGHVAGDHVLASVAELLKKNFRAADTILRYGGDEFLAVLPETDRREAKIAVDRLSGSVDRWNRRNQDFGYTLGLGTGVAQFIPDVSNAESLVEAADAEIYSHKAQRDSATPPAASIPSQPAM